MQENNQQKEAAKTYYENGPKSVQKGPKLDSWGQAGPFFSEKARQQSLVKIFDN